MVTILRPCSSANASSSGMRAMVPSSFMISQITAGGLQPCQARQVHRSLGLAGAHEHPPGLRPQGEDMSGADEILGPGIRGDGRQDGRCPVGGGNTGRHAVARIDRDGKGRAEGRGILLHHHGEFRAIHLLLAQGEADEPPAVRGHEVDGLGGDQLGRHGQIAFVLPVLVVHEDDHLPCLDRLYGLFNGAVHYFPLCLLEANSYSLPFSNPSSPRSSLSSPPDPC